MFHRESGYYKTSYAADMALYPLPIARWTVAAIALAMCVAPFFLHEYYVSIINLVLLIVVKDPALQSVVWVINAILSLILFIDFLVRLRTAASRSFAETPPKRIAAGIRNPRSVETTQRTTPLRK